MKLKLNLATVALAGVLAAPLPAQVILGGGAVRDRVEEAQRRSAEARARARIDSGFLRTERSSRTSSRVPPGHLPPRGLCRVWIDGVPPGQQPPVTDCATAEQMRWRTANARVIYGDRESFPGKGKGKFKNRDVASARSCTIWDRVIVDGRTTSVCRDDRVSQDRRDRGGWFGDDDRFEDDEDSDSDRGRGKLAKAERKAAKGAKKGKHGRG